MPAAAPIAELLARQTQEGELVERLPEGRVRCLACGHRWASANDALAYALRKGREYVRARSLAAA